MSKVSQTFNTRDLRLCVDHVPTEEVVVVGGGRAICACRGVGGANERVGRGRGTGSVVRGRLRGLHGLDSHWLVEGFFWVLAAGSCTAVMMIQGTWRD